MRLCAAGLACIVLIGVLAAGLLFVRLAQGPLTVDWLAPQLRHALMYRLGASYRVTVGDPSIEVGEHGPGLAINGLSLASASGESILEAPRAEVALDPLSLLFGAVRPTSLEVYGVELRLVLLPDGSAAISAGAKPIVLSHLFAGSQTPALEMPALETPALETPALQAIPGPASDDAAAPPAVPPADVMKQAGVALRGLLDLVTAPDSPMAALQQAGIASGKLVVEDRSANQTIVFNDMQLTFDKESEGTRLTLAATGPNGRWSLSALATGAPGQPRALDLEAKDLSIDEIALAGGFKNLGFDLDSPISARLHFALASDGSFANASGRVALGAGFFHLNDPDHEPMQIDELGGDFHWDAGAGKFIVDAIRFDAPGETHFDFAGSLAPPRAAGEPWSINLETNGPAAFGVERPHEKPIAVGKLTLAARLSPGAGLISLDRLTMQGPDLAFSMNGTFGGAGSTPKLVVNATASGTPLRTVARLWPTFIAAPQRSWLLDHVQGGRLDKLSLALSLSDSDLAALKAHHAPADADARIDFSVDGGAVSFLSGVPPLSGLAGAGRVTGRTVSFAATRGMLQGADGHRLTLSDGSFSVPDSDPKPAPATFLAHLSGSLDAVADILSRDGLKPYGGGVPIDTKILTGQVDAHLTINTLLGKFTKPSDTVVTATASVADFAVEKLIGTQRIDQANLAVTVDSHGLQASGQGRLLGAPASIELSRPAGGSTTEAVIATTLDDKARAKLGFGTPSVTGPIGARITSVLGQGDKPTAQVELDLTHAAIGGLVPGYAKAAGRSAKTSFQIAADDNGASVDQFVFEGGGASAHGALRFDTSGALEEAHFTQLRVSPGDDMRLDAEESKQALKITVRGASLDARPFLRAFSADEGGATAQNVDLDLRSALVTGNNHEAISNLVMHVVKQGGVLRQFQLGGRFGRDSVAGVLVRTGLGQAPQINVTSANAGRLLAFADLYKRLQGGALSVTVAMDNKLLAGQLTIRNFVVRDEPGLRRIVSEGVTPREPARIDTSAARFTKLQVDFTRQNGRIYLRDGSMYGPQIGTTLEGWLDFAHNQVNLSGTFVPAYGLNNLFSRIPLFGLILGGGAHEGLFGVNFRVSGAASAPVLTINPLSAIAPGFLRKIFGAIDNAGNNLAPPAAAAPAPQ